MFSISSKSAVQIISQSTIAVLSQRRRFCDIEFTTVSFKQLGGISSVLLSQTVFAAIRSSIGIMDTLGLVNSKFQFQIL